MFRFVVRLTVEFEDELGMAGFQKIDIDILVTGDARICAQVKVPQVVHSGADARGVSPIGASVSAQPRFSRAVTTFARNAFIRTRGRGQSIRGDRLKRRMANGAARARLRLSNADSLADSGRARVEQNGVGPRMKIF